MTDAPATLPDDETLRAMLEKATPGSWFSVSCGGYSTVLANTEPKRSDNRIPAYAYDNDRGWCLGYPFIEDDGRVRWDFMCFSHEDAAVIALTPNIARAYLARGKEIARLTKLTDGYAEEYGKRTSEWSNVVMQKGVLEEEIARKDARIAELEKQVQRFYELNGLGKNAP